MRFHPLDLYGEQFGCWVVVSPASPLHRKTRWLCRCRCGTVREVLTTNLRTGFSRSCGCGGKQYGL